MTRRLTRLITWCLGASLAAGAVADEATNEVLALLPHGPVAASVMGLAAPDRARQLSNRFQAAIARDPDWWFTYVREAPANELPYHPKFGLSETEYRELRELERGITVQPVAAARFQVVPIAERVFEIHADSTLGALDGIVIDLESDVVRTSYGTADLRTAIEASPDQRTGPWDGIQWLREVGSVGSMQGESVALALGKLHESGRGILYYDAKRIEHGIKKSGEVLVLTYDLSVTFASAPHPH